MFEFNQLNTPSAPLAKGEAVTQTFSPTQWVKVRASTDGEQAFMVWHGSVYGMVPGEPKVHLFQIVGMSVARCLENPEGGWDFTSRELTYYLDPQSQEILHQWQNPWTSETVTVMHVANSPVQGYFNRPFPAQVLGETTTFAFDLFPSYANPLAADPRFTAYSPNPLYQAAELFKMTVSTNELLDPECPSVSNLVLAWSRIGPWLPWMKMGNHPGQMIYSASGCKVTGFQDLPQLLRQQIETRVPLFRFAPRQKLEQEDMTSWLYFTQNYEAYLRAEVFPLPTPDQEPL